MRHLFFEDGGGFGVDLGGVFEVHCVASLLSRVLSCVGFLWSRQLSNVLASCLSSAYIRNLLKESATRTLTSCRSALGILPAASTLAQVIYENGYVWGSACMHAAAGSATFGFGKS